MDLAVYISELLGLHGEVNVPEVGYFAQIRTNGYYNKDENKFYPPGHDISFQPQFTEDDSLAKYISAKKNISLASSKYFIDKYVNEVKQHAATQKVDIAGLGYLHLENSTLSFNPANASRENDPTFYGLQPIKVHRVGEQPVENHSTLVEETEVEHEPVKEALEEILIDKAINIPTVIDPEEQVHEEPAEIDEETTPKRFMSIWVIMLILITVIALALVGVYQYKPSVFDSFMKKKVAPVPIAAKHTDTQTKAKTDTNTKANAQQPVPVPTQTIQQPVDTFAVVRYELQAGAYKTLTRTNIEMQKYEKIGLHPSIVRHAHGKLLKITLGTYFSQKEAQRAKDSILSKHRIPISLQPYLPKRK